jgi:hypothetical protein
MIIDTERLHFRLTQHKSDLLKGSAYKFIDNGANILAVAHLDIHPNIAQDNFFAECDERVYSPALDDRLGVYILLDLLPALGINVDVLLTDDEEVGLSTAQLFDTQKQYNWMFQFDRRGTDVVMYQYHSSGLCDLLESVGFNVGVGSFSDICYLDHLGIVGFNFGTAYYKEHTLACYANLSEIETQVEKFVAFFTKFSGVLLDYEPITDDFETVPFDYDNLVCDICSSTDEVVYYYDIDSFVCKECEHFIPDYVRFRAILKE